MIPDQILNELYTQLRPIILELAKYNHSYEEIQMNFEVGEVNIKLH